MLRKMIPLILIAFFCGCGAPESQDILPSNAEFAGLEKAAVMNETAEVLRSMNFVIEKMDIENGYIATKPLRGGQFFELWRSDNVGARNTFESNIHSLQRQVELVFDESDGRILADCTVNVSRLSIPETELTSSRSVAGTYTRSGISKQRLTLSKDAKDTAQWIELEPDQHLAGAIMAKIAGRIGK